MGGFAGIIDLQGNGAGIAEALDSMLSWIAHRGPAGQAARCQDRVGMGVRYGRRPDSPDDGQPFMAPGGTTWAVVDGRIFNYAELRQKMQGWGIPFAGRSDAELVARLYESAGPACIDQLEGEFAFVVWDAQKQRLFAARDRLGIHHLFYCLHDGKLFFASEIKAILGSGQVERRLDLKALDQVLFMNCPVAPRTMFEGISAVQAGHLLVLQDGQLAQRCYWDLDFQPEDPGKRSEAEYREELLSLLREAVRVRASLGKVGAYLSGGLDSSSIAALMRENGNGAFPCYFVDFSLPAYSEQRQARLAADALGLPLNVVTMSYRLIGENLPRLVWHGEAPAVLAESTSLLPLAARAAQDVNIVLNGEGGDELLAGYVFNDWDRIYRTLQRFPLSLILPPIRALLPRLGFPSAFVISKKDQGPALQNLGCFPAPLYYNYAVREVAAYYSDAVREQLRGYSPEADIAQTLNVKAMSQWDPLSQSLYFSTKVNLPNYLLGPHGDRAAASAGIEAFFPFLDRHLMEFAMRLPNELKVHKGQEKYLLKRAMEGIVPDEIVQRKKSPMTCPASPAFLGEQAPSYVQQMLSPEAIEKKGYFDSRRVAEMIEGLRRRDPSQDRNNRMDVMLSFPLVGVLSVQLLDELFISNLQPSPPVWD